MLYCVGDLLLVRCSNCGIYCEETMMEVSSEDIKRLEKKGYRLEEFTFIDKGAAWLRNVNGYCYFYSRTDKKCQIYEDRPLGCYIYPVMQLAKKGTTVDKLCPMGHTVSE